MNLCFVDLETFWSGTHSLKKLPATEYCMHPDTEIISCSFKLVVDKAPLPTVCVFGEEEVQDYCNRVDWSEYMVIGHNLSEFDAMILAWRLGVRPKLWGCTRAMAAPLHAKDPGLSLAKLVKHYELGEKNSKALVQTKGKRLKDFTPSEIAGMRTYNIDDTDQCYGLFKVLLPQLNSDELRLIDMTIRMLVEPQFEADTALLHRTLHEEETRKRALLIEAAHVMDIIPSEMDDDAVAEAARKVLASAPKFAKFLKAVGVEPPMKLSPTTGKPIPALAKTDEGFIQLQEHANAVVAMAAQARLDTKSTLLQKRIEKFLSAASATNGMVPIPLRYYGADTTGRWSGWSYNPQNLPRIDPNTPKPSDALRKSLTAPEGYKVVVADLSGIELRVNMTLWKVHYAMELFKENPDADLYKPLAADVLGVPVEGMPKMVRQAGKAMHLGCGFGLGTPSVYVTTAKQMAGIDVTEEEALLHIRGYRNKHPEIVNGWRICHNALPGIIAGVEGAPLDPWGMIVPVAGGLRTPTGMIRYPNLRTELNHDTGRVEFVYGPKKRRARIYAGKIDENIVQHLARSVIADNAIKVQRLTGYTPALMVHDELVYVVPEEEAEQHLETVQSVMRTPVDWWPELITWSEGDIADTYGDAK